MHPVLERAADGFQHVLDRAVTTIGRDPGSVIEVPLVAVSRHHATVERTDHGHVLRDLESRNGTFVNGVRATTEPVLLRDGDEIVIAGVETLRYVDPLATPIAPALGRLSGVWIDPATDDVWVDAQAVRPPLSARQQTLLALLDERVGSVVSRQEIIERVWAEAAAEGVSDEAVDALIKRLRARLRPLQIHGDYITVVRGRGVLLDDGRS